MVSEFGLRFKYVLTGYSSLRWTLILERSIEVKHALLIRFNRARAARLQPSRQLAQQEHQYGNCYRGPRPEGLWCSAGIAEQSQGANEENACQA